MGGANAWTPPLSARQVSARHASLSELPAASAGSRGAKAAPGQKKTLTVSKTSKANARFAQAVPAGLDIMVDDLRGYVLECVTPLLYQLLAFSMVASAAQFQGCGMCLLEPHPSSSWPYVVCDFEQRRVIVDLCINNTKHTRARLPPQ